MLGLGRGRVCRIALGALFQAGVMMTSLPIGVNPWERKARRLRAFPGDTAA